MNLLASGVPIRTNYLVDLGQLVPIEAVSAWDAYYGAMTACFGPGVDCAPEYPRVYRIGAAGELIAVVDCSESEAEHV